MATPDNLSALLPPTQAPVQHFTLANGLNVYLQEDHRAPLACIQLWYHIGSSHDLPGHTNLTHVLEHMLFEGSNKLAPGQYLRIINHLGGGAGASTLEEATTYEALVPASRVEVVLEIMADTMANAHLGEAAFGKATEAVANERRSKIDNDPLMKTFEHHQRLAYGASAYATPSYGDPLDLEYMRLDTVRTWYRTWYHPNNATLVVVGDIELSHLQTWVQRHFAHMPPATIASATVPAITPVVPLQERSENVSMPGLNDGLVMSFNVPSLVTKPSERTVPALEVALALLAKGPSASLYANLVRNEQILTGLRGGYRPQLRGDTLLSIYAYSNAVNATAHEAAARVWDVIEAFKQQPPSPQALERAKRSAVLQHIDQRNDLLLRTQALGYHATLGLPMDQLDTHLHTLVNLSPGDIFEAANTFLVKDRLTTTHMLAPKAQSGPQAPTAPPQTLACAHLVAALPAVDLSTLEASAHIDNQPIDTLGRDVQTWHTSQGSQVCFVPSAGSSQFRLQLRFQAGAIREEQVDGVAASTLYMLDQGADGLDAMALAEQFAELGVTLQREVSLEHATLTLSGAGSAAAREQAIALLTAVVARPDFELTALMGIKARILAYVRRLDAEPTDQARQLLHRQLFGEHPYARRVNGSAAGIASIDRAMLLAFHARCYAAANLDITFIGDLPQADAEASCERIAAALPLQAAALPPVAAPAALEKAQDTNIEQASSNSRAILAVPLGAAPHEADYLAIEVAQALLGGSFESRLMRELRDRRSLTYGVHATLKHYRAGGWLQVTWDVEPAYRDATLALVRLTLQCFVEHGPSQGELELAVNQLSGKLLRDFANDQALLPRIARINAHGLPAEHYHDRLEKLAQLTPANLQAALSRSLNLSQDVFLSIGPNTVQKTLPPVNATDR